MQNKFLKYVLMNTQKGILVSTYIFSTFGRVLVLNLEGGVVETFSLFPVTFDAMDCSCNWQVDRPAKGEPG